MKVFISWSGDTSKKIADELKSWLQKVIQEVEVFHSEEDIEKGSRWQKELADKLEEFSVGLACITPDNIGEEWIAFEAGALSKNLDTSRVIPILFGGLEKSQLRGPLTQFDVATFNKDEMWRVIETIFKNMEDRNVNKETVQSAFQSFWPDLERRVKDILKNTGSGEGVEARSEIDMLKEILELVRAINQNQSLPDSIDEDLTSKMELKEYWKILTKQIGELIEASGPTNDEDFDAWEEKIWEVLGGLKYLNENYNLGYSYESVESQYQEIISDKRSELELNEDDDIPF